MKSLSGPLCSILPHISRRQRAFSFEWNQCITGGLLFREKSGKSTGASTWPQYLVWFCLTPQRARATIPASLLLRAATPTAKTATGGKHMQYLPGWTVQCINQACAARGHWLRAHLSGPNAGLEFCPSCGSTLQAVPPPIGPRLRMRPRLLAARPPLRPRPR